MGFDRPDVVACACNPVAWGPNRVDGFHTKHCNHECLITNSKYGFRTEIQSRFKKSTDAETLFAQFNAAFDHMPLAAIIEADCYSILCVHGGIR